MLLLVVRDRLLAVLLLVVRDRLRRAVLWGVFFPLRPWIIASYVGFVPSVHYLQTPARRACA